MGLPQNFYPPRDNYHHQRGENTGFPDLAQTPRVQNTELDHRRPLPIHDALRSCCQIPVKDFVIIYNDENGREKVCTSAPLSPFSDNIATERFKRDFRRIIRTVHDNENGFRTPGSYGSNGIYGEYDFDNSHGSRKSSVASSTIEQRRHHQLWKARPEEFEEGARGPRKRPRFPRTFRQNSDEEATVPTRKVQHVRVDDDAEIKKLYEVRFKDMQQSSCKIMGKAFVKLVEPKKQTHHPYTKGDDKAPPWWPNTSGESPVRHREPDHLLKAERTRLLVHILGMIVEPNEKRCPSVQKLDLTVKKLEEATYEVMNPWLNDKDHPDNAQKKGFLKEVFKVAKEQERYKNSEIDGTTMIPIMYGDKRGGDISDDEGDEDSYNDEEESHQQVPTPESLVSPTLLQGPPHQQTSQHIHQQHEVDHFGQSGLPKLVVRTLAQPLPQVQDLPQFSDTHFFPQRMDVNFAPSQSPNLTAHDRRNYTTHDYNNHQTSIQGWQQSNMMTSSNIPSNAHYSTSPQSSLPPLNSTYLPPLPGSNSMHPPQMPQQYQYTELSNSVPNRAFETSTPLGHQLRTGSLPTYLPLVPQQSFDSYLQETHGYVQHEQDLKAEHQQHLTHN